MFTINIFLNDKNSGLTKGGDTTFYKNNMEYNKTIHQNSCKTKSKFEHFKLRIKNSLKIKDNNVVLSI